MLCIFNLGASEHAIDVKGRELLAANGATTSALPPFAALILETA